MCGAAWLRPIIAKIISVWLRLWPTKALKTRPNDILLWWPVDTWEATPKGRVKVFCAGGPDFPEVFWRKRQDAEDLDLYTPDGDTILLEPHETLVLTEEAVIFVGTTPNSDGEEYLLKFWLN